ncbi:polycomb protein Sfmbt [Papilio machaon]|uniref:polycomb protein Sfmbt n=1 Tax=Papilio machaon TaxID=76193 RepID=UPI001E662A45|nr:polycomb protein Sfmbt [Papilio machaon]
MAYLNAGCNVNTNNSSDTIDDTDVADELSIVPFDKDTFAICELCGKVGRRGHFYHRNNRFCSLRCHTRKQRRRDCNWKFELMEGADHMAGLIPLEPLPQLQHWQTAFSDLQAGPIKQSAALIANTYEWKDELFGCDFLAAPVSLFKHAPLHEMWDNTFEGMKVEVKNTDCDNYSEKNNDFFWVASVLKVKGYMGLLRYEGFGSDDSKDFWVNLCCSEVHPVGWCATRGKPLIPPRSIEDKYTDWKKFLVKQLTGARTLPANFYSKLNDSLVSRFSVGSIMEVVDKNRISQVKVASVSEIVGKRLHVKYYDSSPEDNGFWCHEDSPLIHPVGWAFQVGHPLDAPQGYCQRVASGRLLPNDTTPDMFYKYPTNEPPLFSEGMKLEAIDPLNLSAICAATVMQILNEGYMMIRIDYYPADASGADWFCYHQRSPCIFPVGFAMANNIPLVPPAGFSIEEFSWESYLREGGAVPAGRAAFAARGHVVSHGFVAGMRLECADLMDPRLVCVATVARVVADLLKVHFDGWGSEYDQWLWAHSTDVYPVGWCRAVGHRLEGPLQATRRPAPRPVRPPRQPRTYRLNRRRRKQVTKGTPHPPNTTEESSQNSDMGETKGVSPPTSASEVSADTEPRQEGSAPGAEVVCKMEDDAEELKDVQEEHSDKQSEATMDIVCTPTEVSQDSSQNTQSDETPTDEAEEKVIPRLVNNTMSLDVLNSIEPENWTQADVAKFLTVNDCHTYCVNFAHIDGSMMLQLSKDEIIELLEMKVGPSLKIFDLIQQLKCKIKQPQSRMSNFK